MLNDPLAAALSKILNAEKVGKKEVIISTSSTMIKQVLSLMNENGFIGSFEDLETEENKGIKVNLIGNINKCGVIKPRFSTKKNGFEKWDKRYLPAKDFGLIIVSTPKGIVTHNVAKEKQSGGKLLAYCY